MISSSNLCACDKIVIDGAAADAVDAAGAVITQTQQLDNTQATTSVLASRLAEIHNIMST